MHELRRFLLLVPALVFALTLAVRAQDEPSLGDLARQTRQQKSQKDAQDKPTAAAAENANSQNGNLQNRDAQNKDVPNKDASGKDPAANPAAPKTHVPANHVITNEDISTPFGGTAAQVSGSHSSSVKSPAENGENAKASAETWRSQIEAQKSAIASLQAEITKLNDSIQFAPGNCVSGCVEWNERQKQKQDQVEAMKSQLAQLQQHLEEMQEAARQQGYGSSVYEP